MIQERLRMAREMAGMSYRQAAKFSEGRVDAKTIESLEAGQRQPSEDEISVLANTYDVKLDWLRGKTDRTSSLAVNARGLDGLAPNDLLLLMEIQASKR